MSLTVFQAQIWGQEMLEFFRASLGLTKFVHRTASTDNGRVGSVIHIPNPTALSANAFDPVNGVNLQAPAATDIPVTLNKHQESAFYIGDVEQSLADRDLISTYAESAGIAVAESVEDMLFGLYTGAGSTVGVAGADLDEATILAVRKQMNDANVPKGDRKLFISTKDETALRQIPRFTERDKYGESKISEDALGKIHGFEVMDSTFVRETGAAPVATHNLALRPKGIVLVTAQLATPKPGSGVISTYITDAESGLGVRVTMWYDPKFRKYCVAYDVLFGFSVMDSRQLVHLLS